MLDWRERMPAERPRRKDVREWRVERICFFFIVRFALFCYGGLWGSEVMGLGWILDECGGWIAGERTRLLC